LKNKHVTLWKTPRNPERPITAKLTENRGDGRKEKVNQTVTDLDLLLKALILGL
jgi:hypothetical protein